MAGYDGEEVFWDGSRSATAPLQSSDDLYQRL